MTTQVKAFEVGKTYSTHRVGDSKMVLEITIAKRTAKTITTSEGQVLRPYIFENVEKVKPDGSHARCPIISADREKEPVETPKAMHVPGFGMPSYDHPRAVQHRAEIEMYGIAENRILALVPNPNDMLSVNMFAMGILSDVQEMLARDPSAVEAARKALNQAKYCMSLVQAELRNSECLKK